MTPKQSNINGGGSEILRALMSIVADAGAREIRTAQVTEDDYNNEETRAYYEKYFKYERLSNGGHRYFINL